MHKCDHLFHLQTHRPPYLYRYLPRTAPSENQLQNPIKHQNAAKDYPGEFQHGDLVALGGHDAQAARAPGQRGAGGGEGLGGRVEDVLVARVVIDVDGYIAEGGDFGLQCQEGGVVLSGMG